jgi:hypothetical protein
MPERPEDKKLSHASVNYERISKNKGERCDNCEHVIIAFGGTRCEGVKDPILLGGWCKRWKKE